MTKFKAKPVEVDARQYTGGENNGKMLADWMNEGGIYANWTASHEVYGLSLKEELYVEADETPIRTMGYLPNGFWIVKQNAVFEFYTDMEFKLRYDKV